MSALRCFVAIPLDARCRQWAVKAHSLFEELAPDWSDEKWVATSNLHVTVLFLGQIAEGALPDLATDIASEISGHGTFSLTLSRLTARPGVRRARMLWAACTDDDGGFTDLARAVKRGSARSVTDGDGREQVPHVTLCRARDRRAIAEGVIEQVNDVLCPSRPTMSVPSVSLFTSRLAPRGPEYQQIATWRLRGE